MGAASAKADLEEYQKGYPNTDGLNNTRKTKNLSFYRNEMKSKSTGSPSGDYIDNIHKDWWGEYDLLEEHHGYIQWLFPIHEQGLNYSAQKLMRHEAKAIREDRVLRDRIVKSYELMLDFRSRYDNLNNCFHNYLRITRILKCLGEVGLEHYKLPFLLHVGTEILAHGELTNAKDSLIRYWAPTLRNKDQRDEMDKRIQEAVKKQREAEERKRREQEEKIEMSQYALTQDPKGMLKQKVSVKWFVKSQYYPYARTSKFYQGVIESYDEEMNSHLVLYDDGDKRTYKNMAKKKEFLFLDDGLIKKIRASKPRIPNSDV